MGLKIATCATPGVVNKLAGNAACNCAPLTSVAGKITDPPVGAVHQIEAPGSKFDPFAVMVSELEFTLPESGLIEINSGC
jgi:hypothetical protein